MSSKSIGTALETLCTNYLKENGYPGAYRPALSGKNDVGDIHPYSLPQWIIECKSGKSAESASVNQIGKWIEEAKRESIHAGAHDWILIVKRRGIGSGRAGEQDAYIQLDIGFGPLVVRVSFQDAIRYMKDRYEKEEVAHV